MSSQVFADELEKDIVLLQQELIVKRSLLDECRQKLQSEILQHKETKLKLIKHLDENKELKIQMEISLMGSQKIEEENHKIRETLVKQQLQVDSYSTERQQVLDECYLAKAENNELKNEITDLKEQLKRHLAFQDGYKERQLQTEQLLNDLVSKQDVLKKELVHLEAVCKEGLQFAAKVSEEAEFQSRLVHESNTSRITMEEEVIRLMAALKELQDHKESNKSPEKSGCTDHNYLEEWKSQQENSKLRIQQLLDENERLVEELKIATDQIDLLMKNYGTKEILCRKVLSAFHFWLKGSEAKAPTLTLQVTKTFSTIFHMFCSFFPSNTTSKWCGVFAG